MKLTTENFYKIEYLQALDQSFIAYLKSNDTDLFNKMMYARAHPTDLGDENFLILLSAHLEHFLATIFKIDNEIAALRTNDSSLDALFPCKRQFVQRTASRAYTVDEAIHFKVDELRTELQGYFKEDFSCLTFARHVMKWLGDQTKYEVELAAATRYAAWAVLTIEGQRYHKQDVLFKTPHKLDFANLIPVETTVKDGVTMMRTPGMDIRARDGFNLTDRGPELSNILDEAHYCIGCHKQKKDSCSTGLKDKQTSAFVKNSLDATLTGCPLDQKISEMNVARAQGSIIGAFAIALIDNPMIAATGHRICNDCMKACIYQKQKPVDIPSIETGVLRQVLELPYGFEIYSLLTRWNPLNISRPLPKPNTGKKVLVVGMGPAGFTLAHHLINEGHTVVGIDGAKIEPLPETLNGKDFELIENASHLFESLDERVVAGFGGVAEYGITVRWDKNFLKLIRLLLERRENFRLFGGVRFGGTLTTKQAFEMGFDHIALCAGAGSPKILTVKNGLAKGVRMASDFLMALQLTGAAKKNSIANLTLQLPVVVIGGGLTAIDAATEALAYYPRQVEKFLIRYEKLCKHFGRDFVGGQWVGTDKQMADTFLTHARVLRECPDKDRLSLLNKWGGVKVVYRNAMIKSPSYRLNHEEVFKALEEGIQFVENLTPHEVIVDESDQVIAIQMKDHAGNIQTLDAKTILVAMGTRPNTVLAREDDGYKLDGLFFQAFDKDGNKVTPEPMAKPEQIHLICSFYEKHKTVSFFGDLHPSYAGNVVKAMASAKQGYPLLSNLLEKCTGNTETQNDFFAKLEMGLTSTVVRVERLAPQIIEVILKSPLAAQAFEPGQFYRLQNFESNAEDILETKLAMEGLALTGAWVDKAKGLISTIVLEMGGSSDLCALLKPGEQVVLMGPTGTPTHIPNNETVMLIGGGLGNAVLFSIGQALRERGNKVLYIAGYKKPIDRFKINQIEAASDAIIWCTEEQPDFKAGRVNDRVVHGNVIEALLSYGIDETATIKLKDVNRIITIGSDRMMAAVARARHKELAPFLNPNHVAIASINSPMQCMMKEICAQCLQTHINPDTGEETTVFSCFNQDQPMDVVDFHNLHMRLAQNTVHEKLTALWIKRCLELREAKQMEDVRG